jgi:ABC-type uncharacterized transport system ATPase subunit
VDIRERTDRAVSPEASAGPPALELRGIVKQFGDVIALAGVDLSVANGSVHALLGENGAGKSTLMRIAFGLLPADEGEIRLLGDTVRVHSVRTARRAGVGMVHQNLSLVPTLSAAENLVLGGHGQFHVGTARALLEETMGSSGLRVQPDALARDLSVVEQQRLEILKALVRGARLLILDEPTAALAPGDTEELLRWIRGYARGGGSVVLVTHKLREALAVSDEVTVLRRGVVAFSGAASDVTEQTLARAMFDAFEPRGLPPGRPAGEAIVHAEAIVVTDRAGVPQVRDASLLLRRHEIVGIAAVEGSGHHALLSALAGLRPVSAGTLRLPGRVALIPADRLGEAVIPEFTLVENVALRGAGVRRGMMPWSSITQRTSSLMERFRIGAPSPAARVRTMSGGNQQRLVVARELADTVDLIVADNPTRGLDLRSAAFVHDQLRDAAARGAAVVVHSPDLDELFSLATRVLVVFQGTVRDTGLDREEAGRAMLGAATLSAAAGEP